MATETLRPNADGDLLEWTPTSASDHFDEVDESSPDENTTQVTVGAGEATTKNDLWNLASSALSSNERIDSVALTLRVVHSAVQPVVNFLWKENGTLTVGAALAITTSYADYTETRTVRPSDGVAWTLADVNALQVGIRRVGNSAHGAAKCTQAFVVVTYSYRKSLVGAESFQGLPVKKTLRILLASSTFSATAFFILKRILISFLSFAGVSAVHLLFRKVLAGIVSFAGVVGSVFTAAGALGRRLLNQIHLTRNQDLS